MKVQCPNCGSRFRFDENKIKPEGSRVRCLNCSNIFTIYPPGASEEPDFVSPAFGGNDDSPSFQSQESPYSQQSSYDSGQMFTGNASENYDLGSMLESSGSVNQEDMMSQFTPGSQLLDIENKTGLDMNAVEQHALGSDSSGSAIDLPHPSQAYENPGEASSGSQPVYSEFAQELTNGSDPSYQISSTPEPDAPEPAGSIFGGDFAFEERSELTAATQDLRAMDDKALAEAGVPKKKEEKPKEQPQEGDDDKYDPNASRVSIPHAYRMLVEIEPEEQKHSSMELTLEEYRKQQERKKGVVKRFKISPFVGTRISGSETEKKSKTIVTVLKGVFVGMAVLGLITGLAMIGHGDKLMLHSYDPFGIFGAIFGF